MAQEKSEPDYKQFENEGVVFKAKLVGTELVMESRGYKMCQNSIQRLKAMIKGQKSHKRRIVMKISYAGVKIYDEKTSEILHHHEVPQISFIASDDSDNRTFGYVFDVPSKAHQFICFRTSGPATQVMSVISQLFVAVFEKKKEDASGRKSSEVSSSDSNSSGKLIPDDLSTIGQKEADLSGVTSKEAPKLTKAKSFIDEIDDQFDWAKPEPAQTVSQPAKPVPPNSISATGQRLKSQTSSLNDSSYSSPLDLVGGDSGIVDSPSSVLSGWCLPSPTVSTPSSLPRHQDHQPPHGIPPPPPPPAHLTRQSSTQQPATATTTSATTTNRSLVYNHSSVSLNDAALTRQSSFSSSANSNNLSSLHNDSTDKYAVFNDIDNLPSIFESTSSLNSSTTKLAQNPTDSSFDTMLNGNSAGGSISGFNMFSGGQSNNNNSHNNRNNFNSFSNQHHTNNMSSMSLGFDSSTNSNKFSAQHQQYKFAAPNNSPSGTNNAYYPNYSNPSNSPLSATNQQQQFQYPMMSAGHQTGFQPPLSNDLAPNPFGVRPLNQPTMRTPSMMVPIVSSNSNAFGGSPSDTLIVGSAPMPSHQMNQHTRFSSSMVASLHQRLGSSAASVHSVGSAGGLSRQTNPFDDDFFA